MKSSRLIRVLGLLAAAGFGTVTQTQATTTGITQNTGSAYAFWDSFPGAPAPGGTNVTISPAATTSVGIASPTLQVTTSGFTTGGGDRVYLSSGASAWSVTGSTAAATTSFALELKNYQYTTQATTAFFTVSLTLGSVTYTPDSAVTRIVAENGTVSDEIVTYTWKSSIAANTAQNFALNFNSSANSNISIDGFAINAAAVPEPSSVAAAALGGLAVFGVARRRRQTAA